MMYKIGYINTNSLPDRKFAQAVSLLDKSFDFLFLSEHWYQNHHSRLAHPSVLASTEYYTTTKLQQHRSRPCGGIYILAMRELHHAIVHISTTTHSITVQLANLRFAAVYYPPKSITLNEIENDLNIIGDVDILLGDINTRFTQFHDPNSGNSANIIRRNLFTKWAAHKNMSHLNDTSDPHSRFFSIIPDHVFAHTSKLSEFKLSHISTQDLSIMTDHRFLLHVIAQPQTPSTQQDNIPLSTSVSNKSTPLRFHIQKLQNPTTLKKFQNTWRQAFNIHRNYTHSEKFSLDMLDHILASQVQATAEIVLGIYQPNSAKRQDDIVIGHLRERHDISASIQLLKRASRANAQAAPITSSSLSSTAMEECSDHYSKLFNRVSNSLTDDASIPSTENGSIGKQHPQSLFCLSNIYANL